MSIEEMEKKHKALMKFKGPDTDKLEAAHLIGFIIESCELQSDLLAEVKRLREGIAEVATNMRAADPYMDSFTDDLMELIE